MSSSGSSVNESVSPVNYGLTLRELAAVRVQVTEEQEPRKIQAYVNRYVRLESARNSAIRVKNRDRNYTVIVAVALALIAAAGAASLIATSGGPTNMLAFYGGVASGVLSLGLIIYAVAMIAYTAKRKRQLQRDFDNASLAQIGHADIIAQMRQQQASREVVQEVIRHMRGESFAQFVGCALTGDESNNQPILEAIAKHDACSTLRDAEQLRAVLEKTEVAVARRIIQSISDDLFIELLVLVLATEGTNLKPAFAQDARIANCEPDYQLSVMAGLDPAGRTALVAKLDQAHYQALVLKIIRANRIEEYAPALKTQPAKLAALVDEESVTVDILVSCYTQMSLAERAAFLGALPDVSTSRDENPKKYDLILKCFQQTLGDEIADWNTQDAQSLLVQYARYPAFFGAAVVLAGMPRKVPLLQAFHAAANDDACQRARQQIATQYRAGNYAQTVAALDEIAGLTDVTERSQAVAQSGLVERYKDDLGAFKKAVVEKENYPLIVEFLSQFGDRAPAHIAQLDTKGIPGRPRFIVVLKHLNEVADKKELKRQALDAWDAWKPPFGATKPAHLDLANIRAPVQAD